ncbi:MAG: inositol monophosphatase family protein [Chloroflexota bacterium]
MTDNINELELAIQAARVAGDFLRQQYYQPHSVRMKSAIEVVTEVDGQTERLIAELLRAGTPDNGFYGEEGKRDVPQAGQAIWVVDPIDGTTNFVRHIPVFAVSIGLVVDGEAVIGVVYQPMLDELFTAVKGKGAQLNGKPVHVSQTPSLSQALVGAGFPYNAWDSELDNVTQWGRAVKTAFGVLSNGVAALGLCDVAAGRLDGYWELRVFPWDIAAGAVIVTEAGGKISDRQGGKFDPFGTSIIADNGLIHEQLVNLVAGNGKVK